MKLHELAPAEGATGKEKRLGRGTGSGHGKTSGKGHKGQKARSGAPRPGFEGGQMPLYLRLPKRGFTNHFSTVYAEVNVGDLNVFENGTKVDAQLLREAGIIKKLHDGVKILGRGELEKTLKVSASAFSKGAEEKITACGGSVEVI